MAQKMIEINKIKDKRDVAIQCNNNFDNPEFQIQLSKNKYLKLYKSKCYSEYIMTLNINKSKKIVITKSMWKIIKQNINQIDKTILMDRQNN